MPRLPLPPHVLAIAVAAPLLLGSCGDEDAKLLPGKTAREITANLDTVQQLSDEGDCVGAESAAQQVGEQIAALEDVDRKLKQALEEGSFRLEEVIGSCEEEASEAIAPAEIPPEEESDDEDEEDEGKKEKPEKEEEKEPDEPTASPALPPQANGEGKGLDGEQGPPPSEEEAPEEGGGESPSGGVSPGAPAGEGE